MNMCMRVPSWGLLKSSLMFVTINFRPQGSADATKICPHITNWTNESQEVIVGLKP